MAVENAAKPAQPNMAACGPALRPSKPPEIQPAIVPFNNSVFPLYDSIKHSEAEKHSTDNSKVFRIRSSS